MIAINIFRLGTEEPYISTTLYLFRVTTSLGDSPSAPPPSNNLQNLLLNYSQYSTFGVRSGSTPPPQWRQWRHDLTSCTTTTSLHRSWLSMHSYTIMITIAPWVASCSDNATIRQASLHPRGPNLAFSGVRSALRRMWEAAARKRTKLKGRHRGTYPTPAKRTDPVCVPPPQSWTLNCDVTSSKYYDVCKTARDDSNSGSLINTNYSEKAVSNGWSVKLQFSRFKGMCLVFDSWNRRRSILARNNFRSALSKLRVSRDLIEDDSTVPVSCLWSFKNV